MYTLSISRINLPKFGGELKFEPNAGIGQKGAFFKGPNMKAGGTMSSNFIPPPALKRNI
jgi:hypothetical protein